METVRDQLVKAATKTIRKGGSAALNFRSLGEEVGVKSATVHYYFPTKTDLLEELAIHYGQTFLSHLENSTRNLKSVKAKLLALIELFLSSQESELSCLCGMLAVEHEQLDPRVRQVLNHFFRDLQKWVVVQLDQGEVSGPGGLAPDKFADVFISLLEGAILLSRLGSHQSSLASAKAWIQKSF